MDKNIEFFEQKVVAAEKQIEEGKELTREQIQELKIVILVLASDCSEKSKDLRGKICDIQDANITLHNFNYIKELEERYDKLEEEFHNPSTSEERKKQISEESGEIAESLQFLQR